ncbi:hypothetical protein NV379_01375 [Paenibacillus sp. N1-5-1-14]|uniref:hypothetical protein n=1 Tax=Paenibacillus radicibacter TaxID=2972488 RepID=UPI00215911A6|nr:hypothetical protein [Paenibacillus radicibacter]MCR8641294.1 hypothetical protein [Paenibacillus radicibacter]
MTQSEQHQEPIKHAEEHAESAIMAAQRAEAMLADALELADPELIHSAKDRLAQVNNKVMDATKHLSEFSTDYHFSRQLHQTAEELQDASQDVKASIDKSKLPKQVR